MLGIRKVKSEKEADKIASQYERAMSRRSSYVCETLASHLERPETLVYEGFHDEDEVIEMANDNAYGLGGAVWTRDINRAIRVSRGIETGRMWVNTYNAIPEGAPFGGYKASGIGRETHKVILEHYTQMKNIMINLSESPSGFYPEK